MLLELSIDPYRVQNRNVNAPATGLDQTKPKATATRRGGFILQKLALILAFASILAALALSACETTEPSASRREPLATSSPQQTIEEPPRPVPRSTIEEPLTTARPAPAPRPEPSATSSPDYTGWDKERGVEVEEQEAVPEFPWPPPKASASATISRELLLANQEYPKLGDAVAALDLAFQKAGYGERSYYSVPGGFAMASRIEQMNQDGTAKGLADRWSLEVPPMRKFSFSAYMTALFRARPGYYRVIVFVVTSHPFSQSSATTTSEEAGLWVSSGLNALPENIASRDYTSAHRCTALIYEFKRMGTQHAEFVDPSKITGQIHLEKSGLLGAFAKRR
jgi:hypothetical protein